MPTRQATARWEGTLKEGNGRLQLGSGSWEGPYTWASRFADGEETNPEELIGAAHAGCFTMFLSGLLTKEGLEPTRLETRADVTIEVGDDGPSITSIVLDLEGEVPGIDEELWQTKVAEAKDRCPVSKALAATPITVNARLAG